MNDHQKSISGNMDEWEFLEPYHPFEKRISFGRHWAHILVAIVFGISVLSFGFGGELSKWKTEQQGYVIAIAVFIFLPFAPITIWVAALSRNTYLAILAMAFCHSCVFITLSLVAIALWTGRNGEFWCISQTVHDGHNDNDNNDDVIIKQCVGYYFMSASICLLHLGMVACAGLSMVEYFRSKKEYNDDDYNDLIEDENKEELEFIYEGNENEMKQRIKYVQDKEMHLRKLYPLAGSGII